MWVAVCMVVPPMGDHQLACGSQPAGRSGVRLRWVGTPPPRAAPPATDILPGGASHLRVGQSALDIKGGAQPLRCVRSRGRQRQAPPEARWVRATNGGLSPASLQSALSSHTCIDAALLSSTARSPLLAALAPKGSAPQGAPQQDATVPRGLGEAQTQPQPGRECPGEGALQRWVAERRVRWGRGCPPHTPWSGASGPWRSPQGCF